MVIRYNIKTGHIYYLTKVSLISLYLFRWIKYEENLVAERGDWGKPHVSSLTFRSLINLRQCIDNGTFMLDVAVKNFSGLVHKVVGTLIENGNIRENMKDIFLRYSQH